MHVSQGLWGEKFVVMSFTASSRGKITPIGAEVAVGSNFGVSFLHRRGAYLIELEALTSSADVHVGLEQQPGST